LSFSEKKLDFFERLGFSINPANLPAAIYCGTMTPKYQAGTTSAFKLASFRRRPVAALHIPMSWLTLRVGHLIGATGKNLKT